MNPKGERERESALNSANRLAFSFFLKFASFPSQVAFPSFLLLYLKQPLAGSPILPLTFNQCFSHCMHFNKISVFLFEFLFKEVVLQWAIGRTKRCQLVLSNSNQQKDYIQDKIVPQV